MEHFAKNAEVNHSTVLEFSERANGQLQALFALRTTAGLLVDAILEAEKTFAKEGNGSAYHAAVAGAGIVAAFCMHGALLIERNALAVCLEQLKETP